MISKSWTWSLVGKLNTQLHCLYFKILLVNNLEVWLSRLVTLQYLFLFARWKNAPLEWTSPLKLRVKRSLHTQKFMKSCMTTYGIFYTKAEAFEICSSFGLDTHQSFEVTFLPRCMGSLCGLEILNRFLTWCFSYRHVGILEIRENTNFRIKKIRLETVRPFYMDDVVLSNTEIDPTQEEMVMAYLVNKVSKHPTTVFCTMSVRRSNIAYFLLLGGG